jgi:hypothetical protein
MKIETIASPSLPQMPNAKSDTASAMSPRERAIAALMKPNTPGQARAEEMPVKNANSVSPEELSAIKAPSSLGKSDNIESPAAEPQAETKVSDEPLSAQYALLARKEKAIRQREQAIRAKEEAARAAAEAATKAPAKPEFDPSKYVAKDTLTQDPFKVLSELGLTYDQLTELALNAPKPEQIAVLNELKAMKAEMEALKGETKKSFEEQQNLQRTQAITQIKNEVKSLVKSDAAYETIRATNSIDDVVQLIEKVYDTDGVLLTVEEAAQQVEDYLVDEALKIAKLSKIQSRLSLKPAEVKTATAQPKEQPLKTLTNSIASSRQLSARERALLAFEGKLTKN